MSSFQNFGTLYNHLNKIGLEGIEYSMYNILKIYLATQSARMAYVTKPCFYFKAKTKCAKALTLFRVKMG
jgi:hypothetical protein